MPTDHPAELFDALDRNASAFRKRLRVEALAERSARSPGRR
jgi:hypothetical protein